MLLALNAGSSIPQASYLEKATTVEEKLEGGLAGDGGRDDRAREAPLRGRVRDAYLPGTPLRLRAQGRAPSSFGAPQEGQEHHDPREHEPGGDGTFPCGRGGDDRLGVRGIRGAGAGSEP